MSGTPTWAQIIHRNLKPYNILISDNFSNRYIKLTDIGLSQAYDLYTSLILQVESNTANYNDFESFRRNYFGDKQIFSA